MKEDEKESFDMGEGQEEGKVIERKQKRTAVAMSSSRKSISDSSLKRDKKKKRNNKKKKKKIPRIRSDFFPTPEKHDTNLWGLFFVSINMYFS